MRLVLKEKATVLSFVYVLSLIGPQMKIVGVFILRILNINTRTDRNILYHRNTFIYRRILSLTQRGDRADGGA
jgi:hypothetical protein